VNRARRDNGKRSKLEDITIDKLLKESQLSKILSESITKKVIIIILAMLLIMPLLGDDFYADDDNFNGYTLLANYLNNLALAFDKDDLFNTTYINTLLNNTDTDYPVINMTYQGIPFYTSMNQTQQFRSTEINYAFSAIGDITIVYSDYTESSVTGILGIFKTLYVCILLSAAAVYFESDIKELIIQPLEVMIDIVEKVTKDPISAKNTEALQENTKDKFMTSTAENPNELKKKEELREKYEVKVIQSAIVKISALLAIGFGEAGGEIIKENLSSHQDLNPMLSGKKKVAIFGFCDIRNFIAINEALQERTMMFVNEIADIVHSSVDRYGGAANKNIGDAFLMVWRLADNINYNLSLIKKRNSSIPKARKKSIANISYKMVSSQTIADLSVLGFLKVISRVNKNRKILEYTYDPALISLIGSGYKINMGFGLHIGWAIEGAIGSNCKIDASYLSPNVNISARLEAATRQYGVTILISGDLHDLISVDLQKKCRHIDTVEVKGSKIPLRLYTIDVNLDLKPSKKQKKVLTPTERLFRYAEKKADILCDIEEYGNVTDFILDKRSFRELLRNKFPKGFRHLFKKGREYYLSGIWGKARIYLTKCLGLYDDSPTKVLLDFMSRYNYIAPSEWNGYRSLTSK
jgi:class 3 adenylate cyclase